MDPKKYIQNTFDQAATSYGEKGCSFFSYFGERLVALSGLAKGERVLDIATGKGAVLMPAARAVGARGSAKGIDISARMIQEAKKRIALPWVELLQMDAEQLLFPDGSFDVVFCGFALFFFPRVAQALLECRRVLKPGGRLAVSIWGQKPFLDAWVAERAEQLGARRRLSTAPLNHPEILEQLLLSANFSQIAIQEEKKTFDFSNGEEWFGSLWTHGTRALLDQLSPQNLALLKQEALLEAGAAPVSQERQVFYGFCKKE